MRHFILLYSLDCVNSSVCNFTFNRTLLLYNFVFGFFKVFFSFYCLKESFHEILAFV